MKQSIFSFRAITQISILRFVRLHYLYLKISFKQLSIYKISALLSVLFSGIFLISEILTVNIYYTFSERIGDWEQGAFYILLGTFNIMTCIYTYLFEIPHDDFTLKIRYGELDIDLLKPMDAMAITSIQKVDYASLLNLPLPIWLVYRGINDLSLNMTLRDIILYLMIVVIGVFIIYLINQFFVNISFWITEAGHVTTASDQVIQLGARPRQVYPRMIQVGFSYIVPILLCTNLSVKALQHELGLLNMTVLLAAAFFFFFVVRLQWNRGLRHYSSAN